MAGGGSSSAVGPRCAGLGRPGELPPRAGRPARDQGRLKRQDGVCYGRPTLGDADHGGLRQTPLHAAHAAAGGRLVPFAGYAMPGQYAGIKAEHASVREDVGVFDVSHMGELFVEGPDAVAAVDRLVTNAVSALPVGKALYTVCTNAAGTILDDLIVYRRGPERVMVVCNASNRGKIAAHFAQELAGRDLRYEDRSDATALLALQGPRAEAVLRAVGGLGLADLAPFHLAAGTAAGVSCIGARTGYTGEDGFELFCAAKDAPTLWDALVAAGAAPAGLGARDTLRLEAKLALYGNDIDETTNPYEAGLGWVVKLDHGDFIGRDAVLRKMEEGLQKRLLQFKLEDPEAFVFHNEAVLRDCEIVGWVTSGNYGHALGGGIALGYVPSKGETVKDLLASSYEIDIGGTRVKATPSFKPMYDPKHERMHA